MYGGGDVRVETPPAVISHSGIIRIMIIIEHSGIGNIEYLSAVLHFVYPFLAKIRDVG